MTQNEYIDTNILSGRTLLIIVLKIFTKTMFMQQSGSMDTPLKRDRKRCLYRSSGTYEYKTSKQNYKKGRLHMSQIALFSYLLDQIICLSAPSEYFWRSLVTGTYLPYSTHKKSIMCRTTIVLSPICSKRQDI